ncbi:hypothetical protein PYCCODRAFT_1378788 [Trametes coccinea BRFM310]|uniref:Uncharacterized protein n=1 Tax=Trametes coccinea (strain BRFM310) TaxID=1353009 RepID=A0A1Y2I7M8_TRAC3|nr:hypothetical protein PYCCODRAFT_1378788 [Trametes coccinea BRFM310]
MLIRTTDGEVDTIQVPVVLTIPITASQPTATLFAPCPSNDTDTDGAGPSQPPAPPPSSSPTSQVTYPSGPVFVSISTPPPTVIVSLVSSTLADGSVFVSYMTYTSTLPPTAVLVPTSLGGAGNASQPHHSVSNDDVGPIVGGVLGGFFGMIGLVALIWCIWRKRQSLRARYAGPQFSEYEPTLYAPRSPRRGKGSSPPPGLEPKPYEYGLVGRPPSTPSYTSTPGTSPPPTRPQSFSAFSAMTVYTSPGLTQPNQPPQPNASTPNLLHTTSPVAPVAPVRPVTPMSPLGPPLLGHLRPSGSEASVGTAVSYPFPVLPPMPRDERESMQESFDEDTDGSGRVGDRRHVRLSLTLANWNPETDGELFPRASEDESRPGSMRDRTEVAPGSA